MDDLLHYQQKEGTKPVRKRKRMIAIVPVLMLMVAFSVNALALDQALRGSVPSTNSTAYARFYGKATF